MNHLMNRHLGHGTLFVSFDEMMQAEMGARTAAFVQYRENAGFPMPMTSMAMLSVELRETAKKMFKKGEFFYEQSPE
jgi:hypothetical protein